MDSTRTASPRSPAKTLSGRFTGSKQGSESAQSPRITSSAGQVPASSVVARRRRVHSWHKLALTVASCAAIGLIIWSHIATSAGNGPTFQLLHLPDRLHMHNQAGIPHTTPVAAVNRQSEVMLFDDNARLAIDAQRRWDEVAQAEKAQVEAKGGVNLEWKTHHHLGGSVYQPISRQ